MNCTQHRPARVRAGRPLRAVSALAAAALAFAQASSPAYSLKYWRVDSLINVFPDDTPGTHETSQHEWLIARNGHTSIQVALRSSGAIPALRASVALGGGLRAEVRHVGFVPVHRNVPDTPAEELARTAPALFPDPLFENHPFRIEAGETTPVWLTIYAPPSAAPGTYKGELNFHADQRRLASIPFTVQVVRATIPAKQTLKVSNWFYFDPDSLSQYFDLKNRPEKVWDVLGNAARVLADHRQNVFLTPVLALTDAALDGNTLVYEFARLDRFIEVVTSAGAMETIEGSHVLERAGGYDGTLVVPGFAVQDGQVKRQSFAIDDPRAEAHVKSFLSALRQHLKARGWLSRYTQHVLDEPHGNEPPAYMRYSKIVRASMPGVPIIDAFDQEAKGWLDDATDIKVLQLGKFDDSMDVVREHVAHGGQAWYYTCLLPRGSYPNRFIDFPLLKTRLLHWLNYRFDLTGYLHWGANSWGENPFQITELGLQVGAPTSGALPPGDGFVTYPSREKDSILSSIRLEAMREGIEDYELLKLLSSRDPKRAADLAHAAMPGFTEYVRDVPSFRKIQAELLRAAE